MKLEIINVTNETIYSSNSYPSEGIFIANVTTKKNPFDNQIVYNGFGMAWGIGSNQDIKIIESFLEGNPKQKQKESIIVKDGFITETFALKMLAVSNGAIKQVEL